LELRRESNVFKILAPVLIIVLLTLLGVVIGFVISRSDDNNRIMHHIYINDIRIGNMDKEQAKLVLSKKYDNNNDNFITIFFDNQKHDFKLADLGITYDLDHTINKALKEGQNQKSVFSKIFKFTYRFRKKVLPLSIRLDEKVFDKIVGELLSEINKEATEAKIEIINDELIIVNGKSGVGFSRDDIKKEVINAVINDIKSIKLFSKQLKPKEINVDELYEEFTGDPVDAHFEVKDNEAVLIAEKYGVTFDKEVARKIIEENREEGKRFTIPVTLIKPKRFQDEIKDYLFRDVLGEYSTGYQTSSVNRAINVELASSKLNGVVLGPGDEFSFNNVVGERSAKNGYKTAHVYIAGMIEDGIGGGICQVSSTLYNAVLKSNLEITERRNHQLIVGYVPLGQDATVSYGAIDFKFKNNTEYPIKIVTTNKNRVMHVKILGTKFENIDISIENKILSTTPYTTIEKLDPSLPAGVRKVTQKGANGYVVESYKIIKKDGKIIDRVYLGKSTYKPTNEYVSVGTNPTISIDPQNDGIDTQNNLVNEENNGQPVINELAQDVQNSQQQAENPDLQNTQDIFFE